MALRKLKTKPSLTIQKDPPKLFKKLPPLIAIKQKKGKPKPGASVYTHKQKFVMRLYANTDVFVFLVIAKLAGFKPEWVKFGSHKRGGRTFNGSAFYCTHVKDADRKLIIRIGLGFYSFTQTYKGKKELNFLPVYSYRDMQEPFYKALINGKAEAEA